MNFSLSKHTDDDGFGAFDRDHDLDLIVAMNIARTPEDLDAATRMARSRFAARAKEQPRKHVRRRSLRSTFSVNGR